MEKLITGPFTTDSVPQLNINKLVKGFYIIEGRIGEGTYQARDGDPILDVVSDLRTEKRYLKIRYNVTSPETIECEIEIAALSSNLGSGRGKNLYFVCPISNRKAKILYYDYWARLYVHRQAYPYRIYHPLQICSKDDRLFERGYIVRQKLTKKLLNYKNYCYDGKMTKIHKQIEGLISDEHAIQLLKDERSEKLFAKFNR